MQKTATRKGGGFVLFNAKQKPSLRRIESVGEGFHPLPLASLFGGGGTAQS